jgi:urea transport system substrate-binding protein
MDGKTHHLFKPVMIGRIADDGRILPVSVTEGLVPPEPWSPWLNRGATPEPRRRNAAGP